MTRKGRSTRRHGFVVLSLACLALGAAEALAHGGASGVVKERMDLMEGIGKAMKTLASIFKGERDYDPAVVRAAAAEIRDHGGDKITALFPEGSLDKPTEALPTIWQDWAAFEALAGRLAEVSAALVQAAENPRESGAMMTGQGQGMMMAEGRGGMMGRNMMMGSGAGPSGEMLAQMPPQAAFNHLAQTCNACHTRFRVKK